MKNWIDSLEKIDRIAFIVLGITFLIIVLTEWIGG